MPTEKTKKSTTTDLATVDPNATALAEDDNEFDGETLTLAEILKQISASDEVEAEVVIAGGDGVYWQPSAGAVVHGVLRNRYEIQTEYGTAYFYTMTLASPCDCQDRDGEEVRRKRGESVMILERSVLKHLANYIGKEVAIVCDGKGKTKDNKRTLWQFRAIEIKKRAPVGSQLTG